jgi:hypothetical protein
LFFLFSYLEQNRAPWRFLGAELVRDKFKIGANGLVAPIRPQFRTYTVDFGRTG